MRKIGSALSRPAVLAASAVLLAAYMALAYPRMGALLSELTPKGGAFDLEVHYSPSEAIEKARLYDEPSARGYASLHWTYDLAFPLCYGLFLASASAYCLRRLGGEKARYLFLAAPMAAVAFDLLENASTTALVASISGTGGASGSAEAWAGSLALAASAATPLKWVLVAASGVGVAGLAVAAAASAFVRASKRDGGGA